MGRIKHKDTADIKALLQEAGQRTFCRYKDIRPLNDFFNLIESSAQRNTQMLEPTTLVTECMV